ncbi:MAG: hypothetical protein QOD77_1195 [Thermoplasmata archaeon]|nr:hypothetical protein [Thermoplasmata archaeon]
MQFVVALVMLHMANFPRQPWHMSQFANMQLNWMWVMGLFGFIVGAAAITVAIVPYLSGSRASRIGLCLLGLAAVGGVMLAVFPTDPTPHRHTLVGTIHNEVAPPTFASLSLAIVMMGPAFRSNPAWRPLGAVSIVLGGLAGLAALGYVWADMNEQPVVAVLQRIMVGLVIAWFMLLGLRLLAVRRMERREAEERELRAAQARLARRRAREAARAAKRASASLSRPQALTASVPQSRT